METHAPAAPRGAGPVKKQRPGEYACIGLDLEEHPRADAAGAAMATWTWGLLYSRKKELDGFVPASSLKRSWVGERQAKRDLGTLVKVGLAEPTIHPELGPGWKLLRYEEWNDTAEEIEARRAEWRARWAKREGVQRPKGEPKLLGNPENSHESSAESTRGSDLNSSLLDLGSDLETTVEEIQAETPSGGPGSGQLATPPVETPASADASGPRLSAPPPAAQVGPGGPIATWDGQAADPGDAGASEGVVLEPRPSGVKRPFHVRRFEQSFYAKAFADGVAAVTNGAYVVPRPELSALDDAIDTFAPGGFLQGREAWVRDSVTRYRIAIWGREQYHRAGGPRGWLEWLNEGEPSAQWLAMTPAERATFAEDEKRRVKAAARARRDAQKEAAKRAEEREQGHVSPEKAAADLARIFGPPRPRAEGESDEAPGLASGA